MRGGQLVLRAVLVGALAAGLALGGCGRKGALDPPPSASISNGQQVNPPPSVAEPSTPFAVAPSNAPPPATASSAAPGGQPPAKKTFILDWLLK